MLTRLRDQLLASEPSGRETSVETHAVDSVGVQLGAQRPQQNAHPEFKKSLVRPGEVEVFILEYLPVEYYRLLQHIDMHVAVAMPRHALMSLYTPCPAYSCDHVKLRCVFDTPVAAVSRMELMRRSKHW